MKIIEPLKISPESVGPLPFATRPAGGIFTVPPGQQVYTVSGFISNVPEDDYPMWDAGTAYDVDEWVMWEHRVYQAVSENTGKRPDENPEIWQDGGYTNRWRMFDGSIGRGTTNPDSIDISLEPGQSVDAVAFFGIQAGGVRVQAVDPYLGVVFDKEVAPVSTDGIDNWHAYFFKPIEIVEDFVITDIPVSSFSALQITLTRTDGGIVSVGELVIGATFPIGCALYGTSIGIRDFGRKVRDQYGNWTFQEGDYSKRAEYDLAIKTDDVSRIQRKLAKYRSRPIVWIGHEDMEATIIYGPFIDFDIVISGPNVSDCTITAEGLN